MGCMFALCKPKPEDNIASVSFTYKFMFKRKEMEKCWDRQMMREREENRLMESYHNKKNQKCFSCALVFKERRHHDSIDAGFF